MGHAGRAKVVMPGIWNRCINIPVTRACFPISMLRSCASVVERRDRYANLMNGGEAEYDPRTGESVQLL